MLSKMCASSPGASFEAHPAHFTVAVSRIFCFVIFFLGVRCQMSVKRRICNNLPRLGGLQSVVDCYVKTS